MFATMFATMFAILLLLSCKFVLANGNQNVDSFVRDIIQTFHSRSPTIVFDEYAPEVCMTRQWVLCVTNGPDTKGNELADYFAMLTRTFVYTYDNRYIFDPAVDGVDYSRFAINPEQYLGLNWTEPQVKRKHDALIFLGGGGQRELVTQLDKRPAIKSPDDPDDQPGAFAWNDMSETPTIFTTDSPVFMPIEYADAIKLRLDTNIIFFEEEVPGNYKLVDMFAVKSGPPITLNLGKWHLGHGISLEKNMYRWRRRTDLRGASMINCHINGSDGSFPVLDDKGNIIGSEGMVPSMMYDIADGLNLNVETTKICSVGTCNFTCWCNCTGTIKHVLERSIDGSISGTAIHFMEFALTDFCFATGRDPVSLYAAKPKGTAPNIWVYVNVFGVSQWAIFLALLILVVIMISLDKKIVQPDSVNAFGTKRGSQSHYKLDSVMSGVALVGLYTIQMGSQTNGQHLGIRLLTFTTSMLTLLMFVYYTTDITSQMTSGPTQSAVNSFDDVIDYDYKVILPSHTFASMLGSAEPGTSKHEVYKKWLAFNYAGDEQLYFDSTVNLYYTTESAIKELLSDSKTLLWTYFNLNERPDLPDLTDLPDMKTMRDSIVDLKISDRTNIYTTFTLIKHSEFIPILNYYIIKRYENGVHRRHHYQWSRYYYVNEQFGMLEPEPLGYNNVMFPFMCLGLAICAAIVIAMMEFGIKRYIFFADRSRRPTEPLREGGMEGTRGPERNNGSGNGQGAPPQGSRGEVKSKSKPTNLPKQEKKRVMIQN